MPVRDPDVFERDAQLLASGEQHIDITARVDDSSGHALVLPDQRTVLLEGSDGDGFVVEHGEVLDKSIEFLE
jgi:hypothetical protein